MLLRKININFSIIITIRVIILSLLLVLFVFELGSLVEYYFYLPGIIRFVLFLIIITSFFLLLFFLFIILINPEKFYFYLRNSIHKIKVATLYDLYRYIIFLQLRKTFKGSKKVSNKYYRFSKFSLNLAFRFYKIDYFSFIFLVLLMVNFIYNRNIFFTGAIRLYSFYENFYKPDLLQYTTTPEKFEVFEGDNFEFKALIYGQVVPDFVIIIYEGIPYKIRIYNRAFSFLFKNIRKNFDFTVENKSLNHSKTFHVNCISKVFFTNYYCVVNYPTYLNKLSDTIFDISNIDIPEGSVISYDLEWAGNATLFINGEPYSSINNKFHFIKKIDAPKFVYSFKLKFSNMVLDSLVSHLQSIQDYPPTISLQQDSNKNELVLFFDDDIGLDIGKISYIANKNKINYKFGSKNFIFNNCKSYGFKMLINDSISDYDTLKLEVLVKDNCSLRYQLNKKTFLLSTPEIQTNNMSISIMNNLKTQQQQIQSISKLSRNIEQLIKNINDNSKSNYFNINHIQSLKNNIENLKTLLRNNFNKDSKELLNLIDSLFNQSLNLDQNKLSLIDQNQLKKLRQLKELAQLLEQTLSQEYQKNNFQIIDLLRKEIQNIISGYQNLITSLHDSITYSDLLKSLEKLSSKHMSVEELNKKISGNAYYNFKKQVEDSLINIQNLTRVLPNQSSRNRLANSLTKINKHYYNVEKMIEDFQNAQNGKEYVDYQQIISLLKKGNLLSKKVENSVMSLSNNNLDKSFQNILIYDFSYFEKFWQSYRDSLTRFVIENELPTTFFIQNIYRIEQAHDLYLKSFKALNIIDVSRNAGIIMESLNKINLAISELLEANEEENNNMQMDGQQCLKPRKAGNKGKPKPSLNIQEMLEQLLGMQKQIESQIQQGKQNSINGKELLELVNQQQMIREALSELLNNAENKNMSLFLQEAIEEIRKNEKQLLDRRNFDKNMLARLEQIKTRLLEAEKTRQEQEFENKRESKDFGDYFRKWENYNSNLKSNSYNNINEFLKPYPISLRKYYFEKEKIYKKIK